MLLGVAIGDALGNTTEGINPGEHREQFGEIRDYLPNQYAAGLAVGLPSDDTQLSFRTVEQLLADGEFMGEPQLARFAREELVAEFGAAFFCQEAGIDASRLDQSAAYIASCLRALEGDRRLAVAAAGQAQRAVDHILGYTPQPTATDVHEEEHADV